MQLHSSPLNSKLAVSSRECQCGALTLIPCLVWVLNEALNTAADLGDGANGTDVWLKFPVGRLARTRDDHAPRSCSSAEMRRRRRAAADSAYTAPPPAEHSPPARWWPVAAPLRARTGAAAHHAARRPASCSVGCDRDVLRLCTSDAAANSGGSLRCDRPNLVGFAHLPGGTYPTKSGVPRPPPPGVLDSPAHPP
jgi:hypothetical protein